MRKIPLAIPSVGRSLKAGRIALRPCEEVGEHVTKGREEIIIVLKGSGSLIMGGQETPISEGDVHYVGEGVRHNVRSTPGGKLEYVYVVNLRTGLDIERQRSKSGGRKLRLKNLLTFNYHANRSDL